MSGNDEVFNVDDWVLVRGRVDNVPPRPRKYRCVEPGCETPAVGYYQQDRKLDGTSAKKYTCREHAAKHVMMRVRLGDAGYSFFIELPNKCVFCDEPAAYKFYGQFDPTPTLLCKTHQPLVARRPYAGSLPSDLFVCSFVEDRSAESGNAAIMTPGEFVEAYTESLRAADLTQSWINLFGEAGRDAVERERQHKRQRGAAAAVQATAT